MAERPDHGRLVCARLVRGHHGQQDGDEMMGLRGFNAATPEGKLWEVGAGFNVASRRKGGRMRRHQSPEPLQEVDVEIDGKRYSGWWSVAGKSQSVTVDYMGQSKSAQAGGDTPEQTARVLLRELIAESKKTRGGRRDK
jgi:hypothetical protein